MRVTTAVAVACATGGSSGRPASHSRAPRSPWSTPRNDGDDEAIESTHTFKICCLLLMLLLLPLMMRLLLLRRRQLLLLLMTLPLRRRCR